jgi:hypothetical protein
LNNRISAILGRGFSRSSIISSASLAVMCLFYVYTVGTSLQIRIYPLIDRVTHYIPFDFYIVNEYVDHVVISALLIIWLAFSIQRSKAGNATILIIAALFSVTAVVNYDQVLDAIALSALPALAALLLYSRYSRQILHYNSELWIDYLAIVGIAIGIISFAFAVSNIAADNAAGYPIDRNYAYGVFLIFSSASPVLLLLLITCFPVKLLIIYFTAKVKKLQELEIKDIRISTKVKGIFLSLFVLLSIIIAIIPHLGTVNPDNQLVGVDTGYYVNWVKALNNSTSTPDFLYQVFVQQAQGGRPASLLLFYSLQHITGADLLYVVEFAPMILGPALVLVVYFLTRELTSNETVPLIAAFLTAISFQVLIGIYAGFYANWIALIFGYLGLIFLFRFLKRGGKENLALYAGLTILTLFCHVYTWSILAIATGAFLAVMIKTNNRRNAILLMIALLSTVAIDLARTGLGGPSGFEEDIEISQRRLAGPDQFVLRWNNLTYTTTTFVGGLFANFIILGLGIYWIFKARLKEPTSIFIIVFLSVGILPFLFGEWVIQTRVFYNIPFQIPAAMALFYIGRRSSGIRTVPIYLWLIVMSLLAVSNFYLIAPNS